MVVGLVILIGSVIYITMVCKRALRLALKREQQREYESLTGHQSPPSPPIVNHGSTITSTPTKSATTTSSSSSSTSKSIPSTSILADGPVTKRKSNHINKKNKSAERYDHQEHLQTVVASQPSAPKRTSPRLKAKNSNISLGRAVGGDGDVDGQFDHFSHGRAQSSHYDHIEEEFDAGAGSSSSSSHYHHQYQGEEEEEERSISPSSSLLLSASSTSALLPSSRRDGTDDEDEEEGDGFSKSEKWILSFVFIVLALALVVGLTTVHAFL